MKRFLIITAFAAVSLADTILAFSTASLGSHRRSTRIHLTADKDRIKKAGAGITTQTPGDLCFYDPNENGMLQGSNTLMDRIENGASFIVAGAQETSSSPAPPTPPSPTPKPTTAAKPKLLTNNLTKLLNGGNRSQYIHVGMSE